MALLRAAQHLRRKLQEALGAEAAADLVSQIEDMSTLRGDLGELRHEMRSGFARFDAKLEQRTAETQAKIDGVRSELVARMESLESRLMARIDSTGTKDELAQRFLEMGRYIEHRFIGQTRFLYLGMAMQMAATLSLWLR